MESLNFLLFKVCMYYKTCTPCSCTDQEIQLYFIQQTCEYLTAPFAIILSNDVNYSSIFCLSFLHYHHVFASLSSRIKYRRWCEPTTQRGSCKIFFFSLQQFVLNREQQRRLKYEEKKKHLLRQWFVYSTYHNTCIKVWYLWVYTCFNQIIIIIGVVRK